MFLLKLQTQRAREVVPSLMGRLLRGEVPTEVANAVRLEGPKVQPSKEASRAGPPHTVLCGPGECRSHPRQFPWLLGKGQDLGRDWAPGEKEAYPREGIQGLNGLRAHEEAKHSCPQRRAPVMEEVRMKLNTTPRKPCLAPNSGKTHPSTSDGTRRQWTPSPHQVPEGSYSLPPIPEVTD